MYDVYFQYFDGNEYLCQNVEKISVPSPNGLQDISGDAIMNHRYNINKDLHLYSDTRTYAISCKNLKSIEIRKK